MNPVGVLGTAAAALSAPDDPTRGAAQRLAREELSRKAYDTARPSLLDRLVTGLVHEAEHLFAGASAHLPGGRAGLVLLLLFLAAAVAVLTRLRPARDHSGRPLFAGGATVSAAEYRLRADALAGRGQFAEAVRERLRAVVRELEDRGVLDPRPGRTADEVATDGGTRVPTIAGDLRRATTVFDEVWYGGRTADESSYAVLVEVDRVVQAARLVVA